MNQQKKVRRLRLAAGLGLCLAIFLALATVASTWMLGPVVRGTAETLGPRLLGVPVKISRVKIQPWRGQAEIKGVAIGNPEGYETPHMFEMDELRVTLSLASLFTDTLHIHQLKMINPRLTYELRGGQTNIGAILAKLERKSDEAAELKEKSPGKKVIVDHFRFEGGRLGFSARLTGDRPVVVPLPTIELCDLGKRHGGLVATDLALQIVRAIANAVSSGVAEAAGQFVGSSADLIRQMVGGDAIREGANAAGDAANRAVEGVGRALGGLFQRGSGPEQETGEP